MDCHKTKLQSKQNKVKDVFKEMLPVGKDSNSHCESVPLLAWVSSIHYVYDSLKYSLSAREVVFSPQTRATSKLKHCMFFQQLEVQRIKAIIRVCLFLRSHCQSFSESSSCKICQENQAPSSSQSGKSTKYY